MTEYLEMEGRFDRSTILATAQEPSVKFLLTLRPGPELRKLHGGTSVGANVCLLFDVSQSMEEEGKLAAAIAAGRELIELAGPRDTVSLVAFDDEPYVLARCRSAATEREGLVEALEGLRSVGGGMTNMTAGIHAAADTLKQAPDDGQARAIILLSDGEDNYCKPDVVHAAVQVADADIQLFAVGMGSDYEADFLKALVTPSNGSLFGATDVDKIKEAFIDLAVTLANVVATQTAVVLTFSERVLVGKGYKASPDQLFLGNTRLDPETRSVRRRVGNIDKSKGYSFLFELELPGGLDAPLEAVRAQVRYDVPALGLSAQRAEGAFVLEPTDDPAVAERQDGAVLECYRRVQLTELVERFVEAHHGGKAEATARYLDVLIQKYNDVNDRKMVNHYEAIRAELLQGGQITRAMVNASVVASTVVRGGGELPALIDDTF